MGSRNKSCFLYVLETVDSESKFAKIGISEKPLRRLSNIQTSCPMRIELARLFEFKDRKKAMKIEGEIHSRLSDKKSQGEWFLISLDEVDQIINSLGGLVSEICSADIQNTAILKRRRSLTKTENTFNASSLCGAVFNEYETSRYLGVSVRTLQQARWHPETALDCYLPLHIKVGRRVYYRVTDVEECLKVRMTHPKLSRRFSKQQANDGQIRPASQLHPL